MQWNFEDTVLERGRVYIRRSLSNLPAERYIVGLKVRDRSGFRYGDNFGVSAASARRIARIANNGADIGRPVQLDEWL
jgi:hypothetical protein